MHLDKRKMNLQIGTKQFLIVIAMIMLAGCASHTQPSVASDKVEVRVSTSSLDPSTDPNPARPSTVDFTAFAFIDLTNVVRTELTSAEPEKKVQLPVEKYLRMRGSRYLATSKGLIFCIGETELILKSGFRYSFSFDFEYDANLHDSSRCVGNLSGSDAAGKVVVKVPLKTKVFADTKTISQPKE
jgi:hypothetical protein